METVVNCADGQLRVKKYFQVLNYIFSWLSVYWDFPPLPYIYCCRIKVWAHDHEHAAQGGGADVKHTHVAGTHTLRECGLPDIILYYIWAISSSGDSTRVLYSGWLCGAFRLGWGSLWGLGLRPTTLVPSKHWHRYLMHCNSLFPLERTPVYW